MCNKLLGKFAVNIQFIYDKIYGKWTENDSLPIHNKFFFHPFSIKFSIHEWSMLLIHLLRKYCQQIFISGIGCVDPIVDVSKKNQKVTS